MVKTRFKNLSLGMIILLGFILSYPCKPILADNMDIILQKQKEKKQKQIGEEQKEKQRDETLYIRNRELFDIVVSVVMDLHKKGVGFEKYKIVTKKGKEFVDMGFSNNALLISKAVDNKLIMRALHFEMSIEKAINTDEEHYTDLNEQKRYGYYFIEFKPTQGDEIIIKTRENRKDENYFEVEMQTCCRSWTWKRDKIEMMFPIFDKTAIGNKKNTIRENIFNLVKESLKD